MRGVGHVKNMTESSTAGDSSLRERDFQALFETSFSDIWRFVRRRCASSTDADDVAAEVFAVAWRRLPDVPVEEARLWLFGVARRVLANYRRSIDRQTRLSARLIQAATPDQEPVPEEGSDGELRRALSALSHRDLEVLTMLAWDGLSISDMATILHCSPNAVSIRLHKARRKLASELEHRKETASQGHVAADPFPKEAKCHENR